MEPRIRLAAVTFASAAMMAGAASVHGVILVSSTAPTPDSSLIQQPNNSATISDPWYTSASSRRAFGASFVRTDGGAKPLETQTSFNAITMKLYCGTAAQTPIVGSSWVASVFTLTDANDLTPNSYLIGPRTAVGTMPALSVAAVEGQTVANYVTFVLPSTVTISAGQEYGFVVDFAGANANNAMGGSGTGWAGSSNNERAQSRWLEQGITDEVFVVRGGSDDDLIFWLETVELEQAIPEPGIMALLALGGLLAWRCRRWLSGHAVKGLIAVLLGSVWWAGSASAAVVITASTTPPSTDVVISQLSSSSDSDYVWRVDAHQWFGQTFTVPAGGFNLDKISFEVTQENDPADRSTAGLTLAVDVLKVDDINDTTGTTVFGAPQTGVTPSFGFGVPTWLTLDVDNVALNAGDVYLMVFDYAFQLNDPSQGAPANPAVEGGHKIGGSGAGILFNTSETYTAGRAFRFGGAALDTDNDLAFVLQEGELAAAIPEPGVLALLALGGLLVGRRMRRA